MPYQGIPYWVLIVSSSVEKPRQSDIFALQGKKCYSTSVAARITHRNPNVRDAFDEHIDKKNTASVRTHQRVCYFIGRGDSSTSINHMLPACVCFSSLPSQNRQITYHSRPECVLRPADAVIVIHFRHFFFLSGRALNPQRHKIPATPTQLHMHASIRR